ncbi:ATP-binding protein [Kitasatospora sp. NPDC088346]|uniref:ATP-binding protein n=1 Tax=Kitasatospora sp. NPDC088346 TaxID=3364073 RepID=UPI00382176EB
MTLPGLDPRWHPVQLRVAVPPRPDALATARHLTRAFLALRTSADGPPAPEAVVEDALLLVTELVSNALRHAPGLCRLRLSLYPYRLIVEVEDSSPVLPKLRPADLTGRGGGVGLNAVHRLAAHVRTVPLTGAGKRVEAELDWLGSIG